MQRPKYSIIIPIYKIEEYIEECINSILCQNINDYEIILVDDGSPDNSGLICDKFSQKYDFIKTIHKKNGGVSDARNKGIDIANGKYILFIDGDDTMTDSAMKLIDNQLNKNNKDLLTCSYNIYGDNTKQIRLEELTIYKINKIDDYLDSLSEIPWAPWRNIYDADIIKKYNIRFPKDISSAEDCDFFLQYIEHCEKLYNSNIKIVNYRTNRNGSATNIISYKNALSQLKIFCKYYEIYSNKNDFMKTFFSRKFFNVVTVIGVIKDKNEMKEIENFISKNEKILRDAKGIKYSLISVFMKIFGYYNTSKMIVFLKRGKRK